jgi:methylphosphotriester-DNA--protein-cysteine methyltransferase
MPKVATVAGSAQVKNALSGQTNCAFVGSKNSNKFYPPTCSYAKRIKPENVVCFATSQEALAQGRTASTGCK